MDDHVTAHVYSYQIWRLLRRLFANDAESCRQEVVHTYPPQTANAHNRSHAWITLFHKFDGILSIICTSIEKDETTAVLYYN